MDELVKALREAGFSPLGVVLVVAGGAAAWCVFRLLGLGWKWFRPALPSIAALLAGQHKELGRQQGAFFDRLERRLRHAEAKADKAEAKADRAEAAAAECEGQHRECLEVNERLQKRVGELERLAGYVAGFDGGSAA